MIVFATPDDWSTRTGLPVPTDPAELRTLEQSLDRANRKIRALARTCTYRTDATGAAVDPGVADTLRDAVLDQVAYADATDPDGFGLGLEQVTVGPVSLAGTAGASSGATAGYAPDALDRFRDAGLLTTTVRSF